MHSLTLVLIHLCVKWRAYWSLEKQELVVLRDAVEVEIELLRELREFYWFFL